MVDLLSCPFCGGEAEFERLGTPRQSTIVACTQCSCRHESGEEWDHGRAWNRRSTLKPEGEQISGEAVERGAVAGNVTDAMTNELGLFRVLPEEVIQRHEHEASNLANLWSDGNEAAKQGILVALLRIERAHLMRGGDRK